MVSVARSPKRRDGMKNALVTNKCELDDGIDGVRSVLEGRRGSGRAGTARVAAGESGIDGLHEESESYFPKNLAESTAADESADSPGRVGPLQRMRLQVRVKKSLDLLGCLSRSFHL